MADFLRVWWRFTVVGALALAACSSGEAGPCADGERRCEGAWLEECRGGEFAVVVGCPFACDPGLGCVACTRGTGWCSGEWSHACSEDGLRYEEVHCDPVQGMSCDHDSGRCVGSCAPDTNQGPQGCEFFATVTASEVSNDFPFGVAIANPGLVEAHVTIEGGELDAPVTLIVTAGEVAVQALPWVPTLKLCTRTSKETCDAPERGAHLVRRGAYWVRADQPVTVYQFSPLTYWHSNFDLSASNDASLLVPTQFLSMEYVAAAWQYWDLWDSPGFVAVTATSDATVVNVTATATVIGGTAGRSLDRGETGSFELNRGDVLQLLSEDGDLTGTHLQSNKPVQVIGGHYCSNLPAETVACDHMEESLPGLRQLGRTYVVAAPEMPGTVAGNRRFVRVVATASDTLVTFDPPSIAEPTVLGRRGDFVQLLENNGTYGDFVISADQPVLVAEYMVGQDLGPAASPMGDPDMTVAVPLDRQLDAYLFHAPTDFEENFATVIAGVGTQVIIDGAVVGGFRPVGESGMEVARVLLDTSLGQHEASGDRPFGLQIYGYGQYTSYSCPAGVDFSATPEP